MQRRTRAFVVRHRTAIAVATGGLAVLAVVAVTSILWPSSWTTALGALRQSSETLRNWALILAAVLAAPFAWWRVMVADKHRAAAEEQVAATHRTRLDDRMQRAALMLGSDSLGVRTAGVLALDSLASEWPQEYYIQVARVLCAFVRSAPPVNTPLRLPAKGLVDVLAHQVESTGDDVMEALMSIGKRDAIRRALRDQVTEMRPMDTYVARDFRGASLRGAHMPYPFADDFERANFCAADLRGSMWVGIDFRHSMFVATKLTDTSFVSSRLDESIFHNAELGGGVRFVGGSLVRADFSGVTFSGGDPEKRDPIFAKGVKLSGANLSGVVGLVQGDLIHAIADADDPPLIEGARDARTGLMLEWPGRTCTR